MRTRRTLLLAAGWTSLLVALPGHADETSDRLESVAKARRELRTLVASFEQVRRIGLLATDVTSRGKVTLVRPDRLRWELLPPDAVTYWVGPEGLSYESEGAGANADRSSAGPLGRVLDDLLIFLGGDLGSLRARYDMTATSGPLGTRIEARSRDEALRKLVRRFVLVLDRDMVTPVQVVVEETDRDFVRIRFSNVEHNVVVDAARMRPSAGPR